MDTQRAKNEEDSMLIKKDYQKPSVIELGSLSELTWEDSTFGVEAGD